MSGKTNVTEFTPLLKEPYSHLALGRVNDHTAYLMNFKGTYPMHSHTRDELYFVLEGEITVRFKNSPPETLKKGECLSVLAYVSHSSESQEGALVLMVKPTDMFATPLEVVE